MRFVSKAQYREAQVEAAKARAELDEIKAELDAWRQAYEAHFEAVYSLWDNALIEHEETCAAQPQEEGEDIYDDSCDCGAVDVVNGEHFKAAKKLTDDRRDS